MMLARLVKVNKEGSKIILVLRDQNLQKRIVEVIDFRPYFYIPYEMGEFTSIFGEKLRKVYVKDPSEVPNERSKYSKHYEADIPYTRRFMIDLGMNDYLQIPDKSKMYPIKGIERFTMLLMLHYLSLKYPIKGIER